jgi:hypothetical protein
MTELDVILLAVQQQSSLTGPWPGDRYFCNGVVLGLLDGSGELGLQVQNGDLNFVNYISSSISNWYIYSPQESATVAEALNAASGSETQIYIPFSLDRRIFENLYE